MKVSAVLLFDLLLLAAMGCSRSRPSAEFAHQISLADRIVVTNQYRPVTVTVTGRDLADLSAAVTNAIEDRNCYTAVFDWHVHFYAGSNSLTEIRLQDRAFWAGTNQY